MVVLVLTACPAGLRGHLTKWLLEVSAGIFVGHISKRVRDLLWDRVRELAKDGRAIMIYSTRGEQRLAFRVHRHDWEPVDFDGITLMRRPTHPDSREGSVEPSSTPTNPDVRPGWSNASRYRMAARRNSRGK